MRYTADKQLTSAGYEYEIWDDSKYIVAIVYDKDLAIKICNLLNSQEFPKA